MARPVVTLSISAFLFLLITCLPALHAQLTADFYQKSCPQALQIVRSAVQQAVLKEARMGASLLRLHFHDCFVQGCDASLLLDDTSTIRSEKRSNPNMNSARGFDVVDTIKSELESACPGVVSCADILAIAARDSVILSGGPFWNVLLGRKDSRTASLSGSNNNIPPPNSTLQTLITKFRNQGLSITDLVALLGGHTIGQSRCTSFKQRLYNQAGNGQPDSTIAKPYLSQLRAKCPASGGDNNLSPLDFVSPTRFDNQYYKNLVVGMGLLNSDQELYSSSGSQTMSVAEGYAANPHAFFYQFAESMVKMGNISPLTSSNGEIRKNCRRIN
eukprot:Gb_30320 [translate_table: standard]